jgi:predicted ATPase/class 3 adenylate cyclase
MDVGGWLRKLGLEQYEPVFRKNNIDSKILPRLSAEDLKDLGVVPVGDRRRLLDAIAALRGEGAGAAVRGERPLGRDAQRRQLTVMFCDLVGSTAVSARLDPEDVREIIGRYHRCCAEILERNGGFIPSYLGDGVMGYFGYPHAKEHDAELAVRAGLAIVDAVPKLETAAGSPLQARVGIATGLVVVGDVLGAGSMQELAAVGDTPNLAARLQAQAEPGAVVISSSTRKLVGGLFDCRDLGPVALKGFTEPVRAWQVLGASAAVSRFEALRATTTPLVDRIEEIALLLRRWERAKRGDGSVVLIAGEPGIGKSRIAETLLERLSGEPHIRVRQFCSPHHQDSALHPSIMQLERAAGFRREDTPEQRLEKLEALLAQATTDLHKAVPLMADLLSIPLGERYRPLKLTPQKRKEETLQVLSAQLIGLQKQQPVLLVVEDVHWADPTSLEGIDILVDRIADMRVLAIITYRPEFIPPWVGSPHVTLLSLNRLPPGPCAEMIRHVIDGKRLPKDVTDRIVDRTDGVPLFIEELTKAVVESGLLKDFGDRYETTGPLPPQAIPVTLNGSLLARLDRLRSAREVAQIGAALGRRFSHELISAVASVPQQQVDDGLAQLVGAELVFRNGNPPEADYTFKHALIQDAAYSTLLRSGRQQVHARIVGVLEHRFPEIVTSQPALLAQHCGEARLAEKAVGYWLRAGQRAVARSAMTEASVQLQKGLDVLAGLPDGPWRQQRELDLQLALGRALIATKGYSSPSVGEAFARAKALAELLGRQEYLRPVLHGQSAYHMVRSELTQALAYAAQMEAIGRERHDADARLLGHYLSGMIRFYLGEFAAARAHLEQCHGLGDPAHRDVVAALTSGDPHVAAMAHLAWTLLALGEVDEARRRLKRVLAEASELGHAYTRAMALSFTCWAEWVARAPEQVAQHSEESLALSIEQNFPLWLAWGLAHRGWSLVALQRSQEGLVMLREGLKAVRETGTVLMTPYWLMLLADAYGKLGQPAEGLNFLAEAAVILGTAEERFEEAEFRRLQGELLSGTGERASAEQSYRQAIAVAQRQGAKFLELRAAVGLARLWIGEGKRGEAQELLGGLCGSFGERQDWADLQEAKGLLQSLTAAVPEIARRDETSIDGDAKRTDSADPRIGVAFDEERE